MELSTDDPLVAVARTKDHRVIEAQAALDNFYEEHPTLNPNRMDATLITDSVRAEWALVGNVHKNLVMELARARDAANGDLTAFWGRVKIGALFLHKHNITGDGSERRPELCRITRINYCRHGSPYVIYYRTGVENGATGGSYKCSPEYFQEHTFGSWKE